MDEPRNPGFAARAMGTRFSTARRVPWRYAGTGGGVPNQASLVTLIRSCAPRSTTPGSGPADGLVADKNPDYPGKIQVPHFFPD